MRVLRVVVIIGVVLGGLFVGADRWAVGYAEGRLADRIQARQGLSGVGVDIHGFPFLTQALSRDLDQVDLKVAGIDVATTDGRTTRLSRLEVAFRGVELNSDYSGGTARSAKGSALVTYADLSAAAQPGVTVAYGGAPNKVKVTASVEFLGRTLSRSVVSTISLVDADGANGENGTNGANGAKIVRVRADEVPGEGLPGIEAVVRKKTDFERRLDGGLPSGLHLTALTSDEAGVHLTVDGTNLSLAG